jgi:NTE family protein
VNASADAGTAFVFAGGGSLGAVQVGMLKALANAGVRPDLVVGASVGAINAAYYAAAPDAGGIGRLERIWLRLRRADVFPFTMFGTALCLLGRRGHLAFPHRLRTLIESELPYRKLEDAALPCHVVATDALDGTEVLLSSGDAAEALLASAAIPAVFPAATVDGRMLIDGGIASNTPIAAAFALGASRVVVLPTGLPCALRAPPRGAVAIALHALNLLSMRQLLADVDRFADRCELRVVPPLCPLACHGYDFSQGESLIRRAEEETAHWLHRGGLEREQQDPRWALLPHRH